jgi:hypothetical protein
MAKETVAGAVVAAICFGSVSLAQPLTTPNLDAQIREVISQVRLHHSETRPSHQHGQHHHPGIAPANRTSDAVNVR